MTKDEILAQPVYQQAIDEFVKKSLDFDTAAKAYYKNKDLQKEKQLELASKSTWAFYCYQMSYLLYLADHIRDEDATEAAKDLRQIVFNNLQGKYDFIMLITRPKN